MEKDKEKNPLYKEREKYRQKAYVMMLEIGAILAVPAIAAFFLGEYLEKNSLGGMTTTLVLLAASFLISWTAIITKYIKFNRKTKEIDKKIRELKNKEDQNVNNTNNSR